MTAPPPVPGTGPDGLSASAGPPGPPGPRTGHHTRFDAYVDRYATRTRGMTASEIRALFSVASRPEVVSLAGGMPSLSGLPLDAVAATVRDLVATRGATALQYGSGQGEPGLRQQICDVMAIEGVDGHPDDVVVTVGSQQGLDLVTRIFCDPGDVVVCEAPSYVGALGVFRAYECEVVHVEMDGQGLIPEALRQALARLAEIGRRVKFCYTVPTYHNPAGVTLTAARRAEVLAICADYDVLVIEDNPYGLLGFAGEPPRPLRADEGGRVVYLGSFSKTFAPGLRVGWVLAPHAVREKLVLAQESSTLCPPAFSQAVVSAYLADHDWRGQVKQFCELYRERRDAMLEALTEQLPTGARWTRPDGGFYVWLTLPAGLDAKAMLPRAVTARVAYVPGTAFYADGFGSRCLRLSYCHPTPERIREGVRRLAAVVERERELRETFGAGAGPPHLETGYESPTPDLT
ncbi:MAG: PLP-dependent aminotransferase family protein [Nocardioidaceae bacterium]|nr:PLP-dependent aminotransferase family protein [Nocardioidaceae bacterium]